MCPRIAGRSEIRLQSIRRHYGASENRLSRIRWPEWEGFGRLMEFAVAAGRLVGPDTPPRRLSRPALSDANDVGGIG